MAGEYVSSYTTHSRYKEPIDNLLTSLNGNTYTSQYQGTLDDLNNQIAHYGDYNSRYQGDIDNTMGAIKNYGDYNSRYQSQLDDVTNRIANYGDYVGQYSQQLSDMANSLANRGEFSYDLESDPVWHSYQDKYTRLGSRAMEDTLGQIAARTGGLASSYAGTAAQDTYDNYMQALSDIIPTLEQNAYNRWAQNGNELRSNIATLSGLDNDEYTRWQNSLNNLYNLSGMYQNLDQTDYGRWTDARNDLYNRLNALNTLDQTEYGRWSDALSNLYNRANLGLNYEQNAFNEWNTQYGNQLDMLNTLVGIDDKEYQRYMSELAAAASGGGGGGGRGGSGRSSSNSNDSGLGSQWILGKDGRWYDGYGNLRYQAVGTPDAEQSAKAKAQEAKVVAQNAMTPYYTKMRRMTQ